MAKKKVIEPAPIRDSLFLGEQPKQFSHQWEQWFNSVAEESSGIKVYTPTIDPSSVGANTTSEQTFTVTGVQSTDIILEVIKPTHTTGVGIVNKRVSAANQIALTFMNTTAGAIDPASETYTVIILRG